MPAPVAQPGPSRFNATPRAAIDVLALGTTISRAARAALSAEDRRKLYMSATVALKPPFKQVNESIDATSEKFLDLNHDFYIQVQKLQKHLQSFCMHDVFTIVTVFDGNGAPDDTDPTTLIDFLADYLSVSEAAVKASNTAYYLYGDETAIENLKWSQDLLMNSCKEDLQVQVANKVFAQPEIERGGPLVLFYIVQLIVKTTEKSSRAIIKRLETFKFSKIPNEDVEQAAAILRSAIIRLRAAGRLPNDVEQLILDIFQT